MPDVTPSGEDRRGTQDEGRTPMTAGGQQPPATTAEMRGAFVQEAREAKETRDARRARDAGEGGDVRGAAPASTAPAAGTGAHETRGAVAPQGSHTSPLLPGEECDKLTARIQHAVAEFIDRPRDAVEEADHVLEELTARFTDAVNSRRRTLRGSWQLAEGTKDDSVTTADTEQLRLALRDYRELSERLMHM
ncbi:hypothetical protein ACIBBD_01775 [Streptomyces sp. NPDC051315]|uniref:hypothetical protein n=1 Tax=Streptomyces sp. NPDC051315 TaxID=3365650 RepID=UPI003792B71D